MIDSLLFLSDDVAAEPAADSAADSAAEFTLDGFDLSPREAAAAPTPSASPALSAEALDDAEAAAAVAATEAGHAHAGRGAWTAALAALEHSAAVRDALVAAGSAGPAVAAHGWCDVATVRLAAGERAGAREALVRARIARGNAHELPAALAAALAELDVELAPGAPGHHGEAAATDVADAFTPEAPNEPVLAAGGLLWLDTTEAAGDDDSVACEAVAIAPSPEAAEPAAPARIAAVDAAVALVGGARGADRGAADGWGGRLRRLFRR